MNYYIHYYKSNMNNYNKNKVDEEIFYEFCRMYYDTLSIKQDSKYIRVNKRIDEYNNYIEKQSSYIFDLFSDYYNYNILDKKLSYELPLLNNYNHFKKKNILLFFQKVISLVCVLWYPARSYSSKNIIL